MHHSVRVQLLLRKRNVSFVNTNVYISIFLLCIPFRHSCVFQPFTCRDLNDCMNNPASANSCHAGVTNSPTFFSFTPLQDVPLGQKKESIAITNCPIKMFHQTESFKHANGCFKIRHLASISNIRLTLRKIKQFCI